MKKDNFQEKSLLQEQGTGIERQRKQESREDKHMGLWSAGTQAAKSMFADQWREYFYCEALDEEVLVARGMKRTGKKSSNRKGSENVITNGSVIAVNEGQSMIIVDQGKVVEFCSEAGEYIYDTSTEPSVFCGNLEESTAQAIEVMFRRLSFGGDTGKDQRIYYFNRKEIVGNKYGTPSPVPFRVVDANIGLDMDIAIRCHGEFSYRIVNPILFYTNVCGNVSDEFRRSEIDSQLKSELLTALQPAFARISAMGIRYSALMGHTMEIAEALKEVLSGKWSETRGIEIVSFGINGVKASEEDEAVIKELQRTAVMRNPNMAAATLVGAQADAMRAAASNKNAGPMMAFAGMNMGAQTGGMNAETLFEMGQKERERAAQAQSEAAVQMQNMPQVPNTEQNPAEGWNCSCGAHGNTGKFCAECGAKRPENGWMCRCGTLNKGKFCTECGAKKPAGERLYRCDKCGWEPEDPANPPKFCPECGDPFGEEDIRTGE